MVGYRIPVSLPHMLPLVQSVARVEGDIRLCYYPSMAYQPRTRTNIVVEFQTFIKHTELELRSLFDSIDRNHDGTLDYDEVALAFRQAGLTVSNAKLQSFFGHIDSNNDGRLSFEEWR